MRRHLLLIGIDGLRVDRAFGTALAPALDAIAEEGSLQLSTVEGPTISGPSWSTILTGVPHEQHGVFDNTFVGHRIGSDDDLLSRAWQEDSATRTLTVTSWPGLAHPAGPGPIIAPRERCVDDGFHRRICIDQDATHTDIDAEACRLALIELEADPPDVGFVYLGMTDHAGHAYGGLSREYDDAVRKVDARVAQLVEAVMRRAEERDEQWLIAVTTDHGHTDAGGHGGDSELERRTFLAVRSVGGAPVAVPTGIRPVEFTPFLLGAR